ncbi:competence type IV pilus minor pilin ComGF [Clostridium chromiireducens]|nr:competence type IV pilus minor pilin ComGF [Clostridium chromiireducens]
MRKNLLKVGGWMKYKDNNKNRKTKAFTIIESLVYIFLTTVILLEGIDIFVSMYKNYIEITQLTIKYNNYQNFFINIDNIISEGGLQKIIVDKNYVTFSNDNKSNNLDKTIKSYDGKILVKYTRNNVTQTINTMLEDIDRLEIRKKGNLIYFRIYDKDGKEFIRCI